MAITNKLTNIADAIRGKTGKTNLMNMIEMADEIRNMELGSAAVIESLEITNNGTYNAPDGVDGYSPIIVNVPQDGTPPAEAFVISGNCTDRFIYGGWDWFIENYGNQITTENITRSRQMFNGSDVRNIPFELNYRLNEKHDIAYLFDGCEYLTSLPKINGCKPESTEYFLSNCRSIRYLPEDLETWFDWSVIDGATSSYTASRNATITTCSSLRSIPMSFLNHGNPVASYNCAIYGNLCHQCYALDELVDLPNPHYNATWTSNAFTYAFRKCGRLKNMIFATPDGQPYIVNWKSQTIDLSDYMGYVNTDSDILARNSGITADKKVTNDATYQALKDDPDWYTNDKAYSRYNHDSAVATINSLPDTSAYLATAGGTNTIKFNGSAGSKTDGGAINTLTAEEIAVATAKGWTVSLV